MKKQIILFVLLLSLMTAGVFPFTEYDWLCKRVIRKKDRDYCF